MNLLKPFLAHQERIFKEPRYECFRCGYKPNGNGFTRNETRVLWRRECGELEYIRACHEHANELEREGWHEQL